MSHAIGEVRYGDNRVVSLHAGGTWVAPDDPRTVTLLRVMVPPYGGPSAGPFGPQALAEAARLLRGTSVYYPVATPAEGVVY